MLISPTVFKYVQHIDIIIVLYIYFVQQHTAQQKLVPQAKPCHWGPGDAEGCA